MSKHWLAALCAALFVVNPAFAVYKCEANGTVTYSDVPCANGKQLDIAVAANPDSSDAIRRAQREKQALAKIESERRKQELQDEKDRKRSTRLQATAERKCATLARRKKWAAEDAASATGKSADKAKRKARRAEELFEAECTSGTH